MNDLMAHALGSSQHICKHSSKDGMSYPQFEEEIESWRTFVYALRLPEREVFMKMVENASEFAEAIEKSGRGYLTESLLMAIVLDNHKRIEDLVRKIVFSINQSHLNEACLMLKLTCQIILL